MKLCELSVLSFQALIKILLLSDTHNHLDDAILRHANEADEIWHAGDIGEPELSDKLSSIKTLRAVYGNADGNKIRLMHPLVQQFEKGGLKVYITHIGGYPGRYAGDVKSELLKAKPDLFITGHSHILKIIRDPSLKLLHMNPGAAGIKGFHDVRTMIRFKIDKGKIIEPEVIELGKKNQLSQTIG